MQKFAHWFIPHPTTHEKAKLLSWHFLFIYFLLFALLRISFDLVGIYRPGVLGTTSQITAEKIIEDTNVERQKAGFSPVVANAALSQAAREKAANMFAENYWAHYSPSGRDPWGFIKGAGYKFSYAGENLARNFSDSEGVVVAWMNSPTHRETLLNPNYQEIGIAVEDGILQGQQTTLVVQMFGKPTQAIAAAPPKIDLQGVEAKSEVPPLLPQSQPLSVAGSALSSQSLGNQPVLDPFAVTRTAGFALIFMISTLLIADFLVLKRRGVFRFSSHHFAHLSFMAVAGTSLILSKAGEIL